MTRLPVVFVACFLLLSSTPVAGQDGHRVAFTTSVSRTPALHNWPERNEGFGVDAGDSICRNQAHAAGLSNPENFVAWLSDSNDDAYCRVHNLGGKKSANCGQPELPAAAGPWVRTDGAPWAPTIDQLAAGDGAVVYTPLRYAADGTELSFAVERSWTGTDTDGALDQNGITCGDWQAEIVDVEARVGFHANTTGGWTANGYDDCSGGTNRLICMETEPGPPLDLPGDGARLAFVTNHFGSGDFSSWDDADEGAEGLAAADSICENRAIAAGLSEPGQFKAWVSDAGTNAVDRFVNDGPWFRPDGFLVARSLADLTDGELFAPINIDEFGQYWSALTVWTGSDAAGMKAADHCNSWQLEAADGNFGTANYASHFWAEANSPFPCTISARLYCLSDKPIETPRVAFVTPVARGSVMADWPEAEFAQAGLNAADSICRHFAQEAKLVNPDHFVAWLSDSNHDAWCRVHGLDGHRSGDCGEGELPFNAGPWVRTDGQIWGQLLEGPSGAFVEVYAALNLTAEAEAIPPVSPSPPSPFVWTGSTPLGFPDGAATCTDWTATGPEMPWLGNVHYTTDSWTYPLLGDCENTVEARLYCLETEPGPPLEFPGQGIRLAFVTSVSGEGVLGDWPDAGTDTEGLEAADSICAFRADAAGLAKPKSFKAWLSDEETDAGSRFAGVDGPWYRLDGLLIAGSLADLLDGELDTSINMTELGGYLGVSERVWTGTTSTGVAAADHCGSWTRPELDGLRGQSNAIGPDWTGTNLLSACGSVLNHLYCLGTEFADLMFSSSFENSEGNN